jgi:hypothetical protein
VQTSSPSGGGGTEEVLSKKLVSKEIGKLYQIICVGVYG